MNVRFGLKPVLSGCVVLSILTGCGGLAGRIAAPISPAGIGDTSGARSWMKPGASQGALLYATGYFNCGYNIPYTCVYSYPSGELVGALAVGDTSICSDRKGNIFFPDQYNSSVLEYAHGATMPFAQLADPGQRPVSCSVDPQSGDLAVVNSCALSSSYCVGPGSVAIYRRAKGTPKLYSGAGVDEGLYAGYDGAGDLFVDGLGPEPSPAVAFAELPRHGASLTPITIDRTPKYPAQVQWDGSAMTIEDEFPPAIYRLKITGSTASVTGETHFRGNIVIGATWVQGDSIVVPYGKRGKPIKFIGFWRYPAGGKAIQRIVNGFVSKDRAFSGVTVSVAR